MGWLALLNRWSTRIEDVEEETFALFSQSLPSLDLGSVSTASSTLDLSVASRDLTITQSPGLLTSDRAEGTTGAVLWKVTPRVAEWIAADDNVFHMAGLLDESSTVLELGCGISGILPLLLAPRVGRYIATDQAYVFKLLRRNLEANCLIAQAPSRGKKSGKVMPKRKGGEVNNVDILALDWETTSAASLSMYLSKGTDGVDLIIACDCIYNEALIPAFVKTCSEICGLRQLVQGDTGKPTVVLVAQQLRSDTVFAAWLAAFSEAFQVWRLPEELCDDRLQPASGFVVHVAILKAAADGLRNVQD